MTTLNINIVTGLQMTGPNLTLTYCKNSKSKLFAQFSYPNTNIVIEEIEMKNWTNISSALCTFLYLNGESKEQVRSKVQKIIDGIQNNLVTS